MRKYPGTLARSVVQYSPPREGATVDSFSITSVAGKSIGVKSDKHLKIVGNCSDINSADLLVYALPQRECVDPHRTSVARIQKLHERAARGE